MTTLCLSAELRRQIAVHAVNAYPRECCGLIEGLRTHDVVIVEAVHPARNLSPARDAFEIDPADRARIQRLARAGGRAVVGCYHSHPDGRCEPSARDRAGAAEPGFVWVIAATGGSGPAGLRAYLSDGTGFCPIPLADGTLLDPVAS